MATNSERLDLAEAALRDALNQLGINAGLIEQLIQRADTAESLLETLQDRVDLLEQSR